MQLMILGMHRSGTSVLARMLNLMGVYFGPEGMSTGANKENPKGFWERRDVRDLNDMVLHSADCDWNRLLEFDIAKVPAPAIADFNKRAARLILEMDAHRPWLLKEPRLCLLLPLWRKFLEVPVCVHIVRHPVEVASSLRTRNEIPIEAGLVLWERYVRSALHASADLPGFMVSHRQLMEDPAAAASRLLADLQAAEIPNLRMPTGQEIRSFVRADLYRERETRRDLAEYADAPQVKFFKRLATGKLPRPRSLKPLSAAASKTLARYEASLPPLELPKPPPRPMPEPERVLREQLALKGQEVQFVRELSDKAVAEARARDERLAALDRELASARQETGRLSETLKSRDERLAALDRELAAARETSETRSGEIDASNARNAELRQTNESLAAELRATVEARIAAEASVSDRFREIELLTRQLMEQENATRKAETAASALGARLAQADARARNFADKLGQAEASLRGTNAKLGQTIAGSAAEKTRLLGEIQRHARAASKAAAEIASLRREREALRRQTGQLTLRATSQRQRIEALELRLQEMGNSATWRMGAPMRGLRRMIGRSPADPAAPTDDVAAIRQSGLFDAAWYVEHYPDVLESGMDPAEHYFQYGACEGRDPGPRFDTGFYLSRHADVAESGQNPLVHFIRHGKDEGRSTGRERNG